MKHSFTIPRVDRFVAHFFLVIEQILGARVFAYTLAPLKHAFIARLSRRYANVPRTPAAQVDRMENLSALQFQRSYFSKGKPVIFSGAALNWPCCQKWDLDYFSMKHGASDLLIVQSEGLTTREKSSAHEFLTVRELIHNIGQGGDRYLRFSPLLHDNPELAKDLDLNWLERMRGGNTFGNTYYMFMGGKGQMTYLHNDQPCNLYVQIHGEKKWTMYYPEDSVCLYPEVTNSAYVKSPVRLEQPDWRRHPLLAAAKPIEGHLKPGDVMYVPPHVWHQVENLTDSIAVGYRFSSLRAALQSSVAFSLIRILSTNPPVWKTRRYGKIDTNLIWAHSAGKAEKVLKERTERREREDGELHI
jgi:hypothetical protein